MKKDVKVMQPYWTKRRISRRELLSIMAGSTYLAVQGRVLQAATPACTVHSHGLVNAVPQNTSSSTWFNKHQRDTIASLAEIIIPTDQHSPGAKAAGVDQYIAEIVAVSEDATKQLWNDGLTALDQMAQQASGKLFLDSSPEQQLNLVTRISQREEHPQTLEERFFVALKQSTVDGYYLSAVGIHQDLEYQGNTALAEFPGCIHEDHAGQLKPNQ